VSNCITGYARFVDRNTW